MANVTNLRVTKNVITGISATSSIMGMELVSSSVNALILENELSKLTGLLTVLFLDLKPP